MAHPFALTYDQSFSVARYLIEDGDEEYVNCHELSKNKRVIVRSILKAVIG
jgi:hypothetical protein